MRARHRSCCNARAFRRSVLWSGIRFCDAGGSPGSVPSRHRRDGESREWSPFSTLACAARSQWHVSITPVPHLAIPLPLSECDRRLGLLADDVVGDMTWALASAVASRSSDPICPTRSRRVRKSGSWRGSYSGSTRRPRLSGATPPSPSTWQRAARSTEDVARHDVRNRAGPWPSVLGRDDRPDQVREVRGASRQRDARAPEAVSTAAH